MLVSLFHSCTFNVVDKMSTEEDELRHTLKRSANLAIYGAGYQAVKQAIMFAMNRDYRPPTRLVIANCAETATTLASFRLVDGVVYSLTKPDLGTFQKWLPFTVATAAAAGTLNHAVKKLIFSEKFTKSSETEEQNIPSLSVDVAHSVGFNVTRSVAKMLLPRWSKYPRTTAALGVANVGGALAVMPLVGNAVSVKDFAKGMLWMVPVVPIENAVFMSVKKALKPLVLK